MILCPKLEVGVREFQKPDPAPPPIFGPWRDDAVPDLGDMKGEMVLNVFPSLALLSNILSLCLRPRKATLKGLLAAGRGAINWLARWGSLGGKIGWGGANHGGQITSVENQLWVSTQPPTGTTPGEVGRALNFNFSAGQSQAVGGIAQPGEAWHTAGQPCGPSKVCLKGHPLIGFNTGQPAACVTQRGPRTLIL